jgi:hypothetical protein
MRNESPMEVDQKEVPDKLQASLSDVVDMVGLFGDLTSELSKGGQCDGQVVEDACKECVQKIKDVRSTLREVVPSTTTSSSRFMMSNITSYNTEDTKMDSYLEDAQASVALAELKLCKAHLERMKKTLLDS